MQMKTNTIKFFKEICKIPHGSFNEQQLAEYLCDFAKERNLEFYKDEHNNVLIKKKTAEKEPLILQAHTDMVCVKLDDKAFDFKTDAIEVIEENGFLKANGTTLGADNGIGVAQILNILDSDIPCNIEALFTAEEEVTMNGAEQFDVSLLKGKNLLSLDGFSENTIIIESASFTDIVLKRDFDFVKNENKNVFKITLTGLIGGHSGFDITKNRGNAIILLASLLKRLNNINIADFNGGVDFNVIPSSAYCVFSTDLDRNQIEEILKAFPTLNFSLDHIQNTTDYEVLSNINSTNFIDMIHNIKNEVHYTNESLDPTTSSNLGVVNLKDDKIIKIGLRSSKELERKEITDYFEKYALDNNFSYIVKGHQPGFESDKNSNLIKKLEATSNIEYYKKKPILKSVHISVEIGIFKAKMPDIDVAIISPNIQNAHSPSECVEIASVHAMDEWLIKLIKL